MSLVDSYPELPKNDFYYPRDFAGPVAPTQGATQPVDMFGIELTDGAWAGLQAANAENIQHALDELEESGALKNFDRAASLQVSEREGALTSDADVFRLLEALAWEFGRSRAEDLNVLFESVVDRVLPVQYDDGYLSTAFGRPGQPERYSDLVSGGELDGFTALIRAGVARGRTVGRDRFVEMVVRVADHVCETFGPEGVPAGDNHNGLESALSELSRFTGNPRYILQASMMVEEHREALTGLDEFGAPVPVSPDFAPSAQLLAGIVDVAIETSDDELAGAALARVRSRLDGLGVGGSVSLAHRLLLAVGAAETDVVAQIGGDADGAASAVRFADAVERGLAGALTLPVADSISDKLEHAIVVSQLGSFVASVSEDAVHLHTYVDSRIAARVADQDVVLTVEVEAQDASALLEGARTVVRVEVSQAEETNLELRVPGWVTSAALQLGSSDELAVEPGVTRVEGVRSGDVVTLAFS